MTIKSQIDYLCPGCELAWLPHAAGLHCPRCGRAVPEVEVTKIISETLESAQLIKAILDDYGKNYSPADLETTQSFLIKSNARAFETAGAKLGMLEDISKYNWKYDYIKGEEQIVKNMTVARIKELSQKYLNSSKMIWLVVGDAKTQLPRLKELGFGEPVLIQK